MKNFRNMQLLKEQQGYAKDLLRLITENPDLPIIAAVEQEIVFDDCYSWYMGAFGCPHIEDVLTRSNDSLAFRSDCTDDEHYDEFFSDDDDFNPDATDQEVKEKVDSLPWMRCIVVNIDLPMLDIPTKEGVEW